MFDHSSQSARGSTGPAVLLGEHHVVILPDVRGGQPLTVLPRPVRPQFGRDRLGQGIVFRRRSWS